MALNNPILSEKMHFSGPSGGGGGGYGPPHGGGGGYASGYGGGGHVYSSISHSGHSYDSGHSHQSKGKEKRSIALSALTLLAFLFFLHILQNCLEEQEAANNTTTVIVMAARNRKTEPGILLKKRKGETNNKKKGEIEPDADTIEDLDEDYQSSSEFIEKKAASKSKTSVIRRNWDEKDNKNDKNIHEDGNKRNVVKIKTFTKYDKIDFN